MTKNAKLKLVLFKQGMTQRTLSQKTEIPEPVISMGINGKLIFDFAQKAKISLALGKDQQELFDLYK